MRGCIPVWRLLGSGPPWLPAPGTGCSIRTSGNKCGSVSHERLCAGEKEKGGRGAHQFRKLLSQGLPQLGVHGHEGGLLHRVLEHQADEPVQHVHALHLPAHRGCPASHRPHGSTAAAGQAPSPAPLDVTAPPVIPVPASCTWFSRQRALSRDQIALSPVRSCPPRPGKKIVSKTRMVDNGRQRQTANAGPSSEELPAARHGALRMKHHPAHSQTWTARTCSMSNTSRRSNFSGVSLLRMPFTAFSACAPPAACLSVAHPRPPMYRVSHRAPLKSGATGITGAGQADRPQRHASHGRQTQQAHKCQPAAMQRAHAHARTCACCAPARGGASHSLVPTRLLI